MQRYDFFSYLCKIILADGVPPVGGALLPVLKKVIVMQVFFDYPWYCVPLCVVAGAVYSAALYWVGTRHQEAANRKPVILLAAVRFLMVSLLAFLLLGPVMKRKVSGHERPLVVVCRDVSGSIPAAERALPESLYDLEKRYEVVYDSFGGGSTNISAALTDVADRYAGRNLGAVVLLSDGIHNQGNAPEAAATALGVPVYTIALGDTTPQRDAWVATVRCNRTAYAGSQLPMEITVRATQLRGQHATLTISHNGKNLASHPLSYDDNTFAQTVTLPVTVDKPGLQTFTLSLSPSPAELTTANNSRTVTVEVLEGRRRVAIIAPAAHPDLGALKQSIEANPNYQVQMAVGTQGVASWRKDSLEKFDMVILHNLPSDAEWLRWVNALPRTLPRIYIVGTRTDLARFNSLHCGMEITAKKTLAEQVTASPNGGFTLFALPQDLAQRMSALPPLSAPFGTYRTGTGTQSLFYATVGGQATDRPLMAFGSVEGVRCAYVVGEGLWRWRLHSYLMNGSHDDFDQLIEKMVVYTATSSRRDRLHVTAERIYREDEPITLHAEFYDDNWQPTNSPALTCTLTATDSGSTLTYDFHPSGTGYTLPLGTLSPGRYHLQARTSFGGKEYNWSGTFVVEAYNLEQLNLVADHTLLNTLSQTTGGAMLPVASASQLPQLLADRDDLKDILYTHTRYTPLVSLPWLLVLIILLLAVEWAGRKYFLN